MVLYKVCRRQQLAIEALSSQTSAVGPQEIGEHQVPPRGHERDTDHVAADQQVPFEFGREEQVPSELQVHGNLEEPAQGGVVLPVRLEEEQEDGSFVVEGVRIREDSTCSVLKAVCKSLGLSQSGGKQKLFSKIQAYFDKKRIELTREAALKAKGMDERIAQTVPLAELPSQEEIERHLLTHLPYAGWCSACVMARGRQDARKLDETTRAQREISTVSMDFAYTGYGDGSMYGGKVSEREKDSLCCLVLHCSETGNVHAIPVDAKKNLEYLTGEIVRYIAWMGYGTCILRCDQEPVLLKLQTLVQNARLKANLMTWKENPAIYSHESNGLVENSVQRIRNLSNTFLHYLREKTGLKFDAKHPLTAWSWTHAAWLLSRFIASHGSTGYELLTGHDYKGKVCMFGEPIMAYTYVAGKPKGSAKWTRAIALGKSLLNDMHICGTVNGVFLTRSVRRTTDDWSAFTDVYYKFNVSPWRIAGMVGTKLIPDLKPQRDGPQSALDSFGLIPLLPLGMERKQDDAPHNQDEAASDPPTDEEKPPLEDKEQAGPEEGVSKSINSPVGFAPKLEPFKSSSPSLNVQTKRQNEDGQEPSSKQMRTAPSVEERSAGVVRSNEDAEESEQTSKKPREESRKHQRIQRVETAHVDVDDFEDFSQDVSLVLDPNDVNDESWMEIDDEELKHLQNQFLVYRCFGDDDPEPQLTADELRKLDDLADKIELTRIFGMGVLRKLETLSADELDQVSSRSDSNLTAKYVRTWRLKEDAEGKYWLRRSRLVAREYQFLEERNDTFSPASSTSIVRLLPALLTSGEFPIGWCLCGCDIGDAFLMVPQSQLRRVRIVDTNETYIIAKCLPGQRDGTKRWFQFFTNYLAVEHGMETCTECPALVRGDHCVLLLHVDDVLMVGDPHWIQSEFIPKLKENFKFTF